jgi:hypothetical protein
MTTEDETPIVADRRDGLGSETMVDMDGSASGIAAHARALAERGLHAQAAGDAEEADRLLSEAQRLDPDAVAIVLNEHDAAVAPDARDTTTADRDACRAGPAPRSDVAAAAYPGSTG